MTNPHLVRLLGAVAIAATACSDSSVLTSATPAAPPASTGGPSTSTSCAAPTLAVGQVVTGISGQQLCLSGSTAAAEYALIPFNTSESPNGVNSVSFAFTGTTGAAAASNNVVTTSTLFGMDSSMLHASRSTSFERQLRLTERSVLPKLMTAARSWRAMRTTTGTGARYSIGSAATVGQVVRLNANGNSACSSPDYRGARIMAVGTRAIVVADTLNPANGFTSADYVSMAAQFDTLIDPLDRKYFGDPSDIDNNGHVILFFTSAVNALTPANSNSYVSGFFFSRDLFPTSGTSASDVCAGSNVGEMFYLLVPDPTGSVNGNVFSKTRAADIAAATIGHEYQHLINSSRRLYVNNADGWEDTWLDEGLSHIAEELLFYKASGLSAGGNVDITKLRSSSAYLNAFNEYQSSNVGRYIQFLERPSTSSPYAADDELWSRGASWSFLRYLADRTGGESTLWHSLANSTKSGMTNLRAALGTSDIASLARDWATSVFADDIAALTTVVTQPSWNFRSLLPAMGVTFPLKTMAPLAGGTTSVTLNGGGVAFLRFGVPAGGNATIDWASLPASVTLSLVRTK